MLCLEAKRKEEREREADERRRENEERRYRQQEQERQREEAGKISRSTWVAPVPHDRLEGEPWWMISWVTNI